ncbi:NAD(P)/FAD-dependent oxidoreductase [Alkalicoccus daliensis]|uniref:Ferredoxin--NADP reductase n=1 Tax=Alkalicoccus daliensis TaxID=745820 RepID=A0A1H0HU28_9BACI|nr:NAD(P)/FAD-dependent oxidoreductase [Alkalicoccus daliensis]SDO22643.1 thioredoxin reductase (NADPH) [Alkalicoccus daliensis]
MTIKDVTVIGGGPAGLYAAFYSGVRGLQTRIVESQAELGGKVRLYPEKMIWDVGGVPPVTGEGFRKNLIAQGLTFDPEVMLQTTVEDIKKREDGIFEVITAEGESLLSRSVVIAAGGGIITPQRLEVEGAERFEITNLHYTVQSLKTFKDKTVLISGGGNAAIDWANELEGIAKNVILSCRNETLKAHESEVEKLMCSTIDCQFLTSIQRLIADEEGTLIKQVELKCGEEAGKIMEVDHVLVNHGYERELAFLKESSLGLEMSEHQRITADANGKTNIPGIFTAGDVMDHEGKLNLLAGAFQDAANAVNAVKTYLEPDANAKAMVSSHNEIFAARNKQLKKQAALSH